MFGDLNERVWGVVKRVLILARLRSKLSCIGIKVIITVRYHHLEDKIEPSFLCHVPFQLCMLPDIVRSHRCLPIQLPRTPPCIKDSEWNSL